MVAALYLVASRTVGVRQDAVARHPPPKKKSCGAWKAVATQVMVRAWVVVVRGCPSGAVRAWVSVGSNASVTCGESLPCACKPACGEIGVRRGGDPRACAAAEAGQLPPAADASALPSFSASLHRNMSLPSQSIAAASSHKVAKVTQGAAQSLAEGSGASHMPHLSKLNWQILSGARHAKHTCYP